MDDQTIVALYFAREERAIAATKEKYGNLCFHVAYNVLHNREDAEECVNDTYIGDVEAFVTPDNRVITPTGTDVSMTLEEPKDYYAYFRTAHNVYTP